MDQGKDEACIVTHTHIHTHKHTIVREGRFIVDDEAIFTSTNDRDRCQKLNGEATTDCFVDQREKESKSECVYACACVCMCE